MCGILGMVDRRSLSEESLVRMRDTMAHRGPDDSGIFISPDRKVGLAHRRLSIIDLSRAGCQPMSDEEGRIWITYNGEVYNFQEIRQELENEGYGFKSLTDAEVIINAYKRWGTDCLTRFNGMFAFGIYDVREGMIFLARDRVGKKPLYYTANNGKFSFASEIKALIADKSVSRGMDLKALNFYLTFGYISGELSIFKAIRKLPPAHAMVYDINTGREKIWSYWEPPLPAENIPSEDKLLEELEPLLEDAVRLRMISDVPLGAFLSGGIDSSLVVAMMSRVSSVPVKTFSIGFEEESYNELPYARVVAEHFDTDHHEIVVKPDAFSVLPEIVRQFDEPFADSSMIPTYYVSKATREHVTVALSGDGGDELFGGYNRYLATLGNFYAAMLIPSLLRKGISGAAEYLPDSFAAKRQLLRLKLEPIGAFVDRLSHAYFKEKLRRELLKGDVVEELNNAFLEPEASRSFDFAQEKSDFVNRLAYIDFKTSLPDDYLVKVDRASMLVSLEVRSPLLDHRIVEFSFRNLPGRLKLKRATRKYVLKKLAMKTLPRELELNRKMGFAIPVSEWFSGPLFSRIREILLGSRDEYFNHDYIEKLLSEHKAGIDHSGRLFTLLVLFLWKREYHAG